jgi:hypothetical protein
MLLKIDTFSNQKNKYVAIKVEMPILAFLKTTILLQRLDSLYETSKSNTFIKSKSINRDFDNEKNRINTF